MYLIYSVVIPNSKETRWRMQDALKDSQNFYCSCWFWFVSLEVFSLAHILLILQTSTLRQSIFLLSSFSVFLYSGIQKPVLIFSFYSFLCSFLLSTLPIIPFFHTVLPVPCSIFPLCLFSLFLDPPFCFIFKSAILSFLFFYYYILSAVPFSTINIQSLPFLLFFIILESSIYDLAIFFALASVFFTLRLFGQDLMTLPILCFFLSLFSLSLCSLSVILIFFFAAVFFFSFFALFSPLFYMLLLFLLLVFVLHSVFFSSLFHVLLLFLPFVFVLHSDPLFSYLYLYLFFYNDCYFRSFCFVCIAFTTSAHWLWVLSVILYAISAVWHFSLTFFDTLLFFCVFLLIA